LQKKKTKKQNEYLSINCKEQNNEHFSPKKSIMKNCQEHCEEQNKRKYFVKKNHTKKIVKKHCEKKGITLF
jgi:hypothetical protein